MQSASQNGRRCRALLAPFIFRSLRSTIYVRQYFQCSFAAFCDLKTPLWNMRQIFPKEERDSGSSGCSWQGAGSARRLSRVGSFNGDARCLFGCGGCVVSVTFVEFAVDCLVVYGKSTRNGYGVEWCVRIVEFDWASLLKECINWFDAWKTVHNSHNYSLWYICNFKIL